MTLNTRQVLVTLKGENYTKGEGEEKTDLTVGDVLGNIMVSQKATDPWKQFLLTKKIASEDTIELKSDEVVFLKQLLQDHAKGERAFYFPFIIGQVIDILEHGTESKNTTK